jgi:5-methyltetrahydrofolate--homocysteine methyltransferase
MDTVLRSANKEVVIGADRPFCVIGERINPTGRKIFSEQLRRDDLSRIEIDVAQQVAGGAMVLDVNMGAPLADETELMIKAVKLIQSVTDLPLCLDSSIVEVLEAGLETYQGKALVNSVTAEDERLEAILPLVARHRAAVIGLPNDENEIPEDPSRRLELARKIIDTATGTYGIPIDDVLIDPLAMPIGADTSVVVRTLETLQLLREEFGVNTTLGASNVSFGMPDRAALVAAFLPMASAAGLTSAIMDARSPELVRAARACDLLLNRDEWGATWIAAHRASVSAATAANAATAVSTSAVPSRGDDPPEPPEAASAAATT